MNFIFNMKSKTKIALISILCIGLLFIGIFSWLHYLVINNYIRECFDNMRNVNTGNIDLPITAIAGCKNICGPLGQCRITGEQCLSDEDCFGCRALNKKNLLQQYDYEEERKLNDTVIGWNDSGKSTGNVPQFSSLTSDFTKNSKNVNGKDDPLHLSYRVNVWKDQYDTGMKLFDDRYHEDGKQMYQPRLTLSGEFIDDGPFASNWGGGSTS